MPLDQKKLSQYVHETWEESVLPTLSEYITIPNLSPEFDKEWKAHGFVDQAIDLLVNWVKNQDVKGLSIEVVRLENRTPVIFMEIEGEEKETALLYGHLDKQPPMNGWDEGLDPFKPVIKEGRLYGRGGADDGYSTFAAINAIKAMQEQGASHPRSVIIIEACEESGSYDLPFYIDYLSDRIGIPSLVVCLDSGCGNYDQLWVSTSLRGMAMGVLRVDVLKQGVHSGEASGIVPSSFRIMRSLLSRLENEKTGEILVKEAYVEIPQDRQDQALRTASVLGDGIIHHFPFAEGTGPVTTDQVELLLNQTWKPVLAITGADGLPLIDGAGNVLRPSTSVKVSLRIPPTCDSQTVLQKLKALFETDVPYGAKATFTMDEPVSGWNAPAMSSWLETSLQEASLTYFGKEACYFGMGGSIPFMNLLGKKYPKAQFMITGVLGPGANAHGPNEFLEIVTAKRLTCCVAQVLEDLLLKKE